MTKLDVATKDFAGLRAGPPPACSPSTTRPAAAGGVDAAGRRPRDARLGHALKLSDGQPMSCLLESVEGGAVRGRYSIIGIAPDVVWRAFGDKAEINRRPQSRSRTPSSPRSCRPSNRCARCWPQSRIDLPAELPPIAAGVIGYMGYDTVRLVEHLPQRRGPMRSACPTACSCGRPSWSCSTPSRTR